MPIKNKGNYRLSEVVKLQVANDWPTAQVTYTSDILEVSSNLYFTNTRVLDALTTSDVQVNNLTVSGDLIVQGNTVTLNTGILTVEDLNITLANGAVNAAAADGAGFYIQGADANLTYVSSTDRFVVNRSFETTGNLYANGIIIKNIQVSDSVLTGSTSANNIVADTVTSNIWNRLYTANVVETAGNLYYTNNRARTAFTAGDNIIIDWSTGVISAAAIATVINDSVTVTATAATTTYPIGRSVSDSKNCLVIIEGLIQIPTTDYSIVGSDLVLTSQPPVGASIEVRFFGTDSVIGTSPTLQATVDSFVADGANASYRLTGVPPSKAYVTVIIDGVTQQSETYSVVGRTLQLSGTPAVGANIDVRVFSGVSTASFNTRTFVGDGNTTVFSISEGFTNDTILVFENGVAQLPEVDYNYNVGILTFTTAPAPNVIVQVRELSQSGPNVVAQLAGVEWQLGNLIPKVNDYYTIGSSNLRYNKLYLTEANSLVFGNTTISVSGDTLTVSANGAVSTLATASQLTTQTVTETTNLYFTNARVAPALAHSDVSKLMLSPFLFMK